MIDTQAARVSVGGGLAGARAIINLRANNHDGPVTLVSEEALLPYDRPPLSKSALTEPEVSYPAWLLDTDIVRSLKAEMRLGTPVSGIDRINRTISLADGSQVAYAKLLLATGAKPRQLNCPGAEKALTLRDFQDAVVLKQRFAAGQRIVIIGGGFIGLELAAAASQRGCHVTLVEAQPRILMRGVPERIADIVRARHEAAGINILTGVGVNSLGEGTVVLANGTVLPADTVIAGVGAVPETRLAEAAGLAIDNGIACDETLRTSDPDIYAAGDCCSFLHQTYGRRLRLEAWRSAQEQAATAAENMLGGNKKHMAVPWFWSDQHDLSLQIAGMPELGPKTVERRPTLESLILFHVAESGQLMGASGIGPGNGIARDIKLAEMLMAKQASPDAAALADPAIQLKSLLKG